MLSPCSSAISEQKNHALASSLYEWAKCECIDKENVTQKPVSVKVVREHLTKKAISINFSHPVGVTLEFYENPKSGTGSITHIAHFFQCIPHV
jgi:hypothetical protein